MSHRGGGGGYTRGGSGFRQRGRSSGTPYWKDKQRQVHVRDQGGPRDRDRDLDSSTTNVDHLSTTPTREEAGNHSLTEDPPTAEANKPAVKKFSNKARVFIANLPRDMQEAELRGLFEPHGEVQEVYLQKEKNFGFCRMAYKSEAERAIAALNGSVVNGRDLKVRFAASHSSVKVDNIHPLVSNERLMEAFSQFGEVEEAVVVTDDRGKSKGYGIVDFARKQGAVNAISRCRNSPYLITKSPIPVVVSEYLRDNEDDGQPEKNIPKNQSFNIEYEVPPRFPAPSELDFMIASRWKAVFDEERVQRDELETRIKENRAAVREQMGDIRKQHETELLRQELAHHQAQGLRLMQRLSERESNLMPPVSGATIYPQGAPPLFPVGDQETSDASQVNIPGLGGLLPPSGGGVFPQPLMGQPGFETYH